ncbi:unnamed protein product [Dibothriocephalus latus]|uniref:EF-hand domain-containing protein n=1 Tax=Dibothriocephalus latus TaxID=60516 RepID=A0A3P6TK02_DIBLA|nr:unnamed protein product [Dibothriocephalus latus]
MAMTNRTNHIMQENAKKKLGGTTDCIEKLRLQCLSRGGSGIMGLARQFKIMDDDGNRSLDFKEFMKGCGDFGLQISKDECQEIFNAIDKDQSRTLDFDEFLQALRPPLSNARINLINQAFIKMDRTKDGVITAEDLKGVYNVSKHPKYLNGEWTEDQVFAEYLKTFEVGGEVDATVSSLWPHIALSFQKGSMLRPPFWEMLFFTYLDARTNKRILIFTKTQVTKEEFLNYYSGLSASIDSDVYFDLMMRNAFKL